MCALFEVLTRVEEPGICERHGPHHGVPVVHEKQVLEVGVKLQVASAGGQEGRDGRTDAWRNVARARCTGRAEGTRQGGVNA